jgi:putative MATE family efflux protein
MATSETAQSVPALSLRQRVLRLALPSVGEQLLNTLVGLTDVFLVGHLSAAASAQLGYGSAVAITAVGLGNNMSWLVTVMFMAAAVGSTALVARARGAKNMEEANQVLRQSMLVGLVMGLLATLLGFLGAEGFLRMLGAAPDVLPIGVAFIHTTSTTFLLAALLFVGTAVLRGVGDTKTPLYLMLIVNLINIVVAWLLINGNLGLPALGAEGAAIGTAVARGFGGVALIALLVRGRGELKLQLNLRPDPALLQRILRVGAPSAGEQLVFQGAILIFIGFVTGLGTTTYAAHNLVINIESFSFLPGMGYAAAAAALVGQGLGAGKPHEARASANEALVQATIMMCSLGVIMVLFPRTLLSAFTNDPAVIALGVVPMIMGGLFQFPLAVNFIMSGALRGAGDTRWPLYTKLISTWGVRLPLVLLFGWLGFGLIGIWIAMGTDFIIQAWLAYRRFRQGRWQTIKV